MIESNKCPEMLLISPLFLLPPTFLQEYQAIVDAEWTILYDKLEKIHLSGAKVVLSKLPIGDVATQYFADRDLFCAGRVQEEDMKRTMMVGNRQKLYNMKMINID